MDESHGYQIEEIACPVCGKDTGKAITHIMDIPFYKDYAMINTSCSSCGYRATDFINLFIKDHTIQTYVIEEEPDGVTKVVRSRDGIVSIPELGIKIEPVNEGNTWIRNIEGILEDIKQKLLISLRQLDESSRPDILDRLEQLDRFMQFKEPFTIIVEDPSGNSLILPADESKLETKVVQVNKEK